MTFAAPRLQALETSGQRTFNAGLRDLFATLDDLLTCGGDGRLALDPVRRINEYGCAPMPSPQALCFASSTASPISGRAYDRAGLAREELMRSAIAIGLEEALELRIEEMRDELRAHLQVSGADVIFSPSGTDSQLHALALGRALLGGRLTTVVVGSDQTGGGTVLTARGRHFSRSTASGVAVRKDTPISGLAGDSVAVPLMDTLRLAPRADADLAVLAAVEAAIAGGSRVLLQVMDASKLGWRAPSDACLDEIAQRWPRDVLVVVDACQMRLSRRRLRTYLDRGYLVLLTGSKYFGGPAFSGALLVPSRLAPSFNRGEEIAAGLRDYAGRSDWPRHWTALRSQFASRANLGQWLRWEAALEEIGSYYQVPDAFRAMALRELGMGIENLLVLSPSLRLIGAASQAVSADDEEFSETTIFPFVVSRDGAALSVHDGRLLYRALAQDLSEAVGGSEADREIAACRCLVGQPVRIELPDGEATAALRLCLGAGLVTEAWSHDPVTSAQNLYRELDRVAEIIAKIELLLAHGGGMELLEPSYGI
jgi:hypothetical protein